MKGGGGGRKAKTQYRQVMHNTIAPGQLPLVSILSTMGYSMEYPLV